MREGGVEPPRDCAHWILSPARLPIPPLSRVRVSRRPRPPCPARDLVPTGEVYRTGEPPARNRVSNTLPWQGAHADIEAMTGAGREVDGAAAPDVPGLDAHEVGPLVVAEIGERPRPLRTRIPHHGRRGPRLGHLQAAPPARILHDAGRVPVVVDADSLPADAERGRSFSLPRGPVGLVDKRRAREARHRHVRRRRQRPDRCGARSRTRPARGRGCRPRARAGGGPRSRRGSGARSPRATPSPTRLRVRT